MPVTKQEKLKNEIFKIYDTGKSRIIKKYNLSLYDIQTILSLIKEQQEQIDKKDKQIELMARAIDNYDSQLEINTFKDKEHIKQYFGELAEKE